jgi:hypothetical protein
MTKRYHVPRVLVVSVAIVSAVDISACKTPTSDVLKLGPDTYRISTSAPPIRGGAVEAKRLALSEANDICANSGKETFVVSYKTSENNAEGKFSLYREGLTKAITTLIDFDGSIRPLPFSIFITVESRPQVNV